MLVLSQAREGPPAGTAALAAVAVGRWDKRGRVSEVGGGCAEERVQEGKRPRGELCGLGWDGNLSLLSRTLYGFTVPPAK